MTTIHSYTNDQNVLDGPHKDLRRARTAGNQHHSDVDRRRESALSDDSGGAGTFDGFALRVPTPTVSMIYLVAQVKRPTTKEELNAILRRAAEGDLAKYVAYTEEELVSSDFKKNPKSSIVDAQVEQRERRSHSDRRVVRQRVGLFVPARRAVARWCSRRRPPRRRCRFGG